MGEFIKAFKCGAVEAAIFENEITTKSGKIEKVYKTVLQKRYMDKNGEWASTNSFDLNEYAKAMLVFGKAYEYCMLGDGAVRKIENSQD